MIFLPVLLVPFIVWWVLPNAWRPLLPVLMLSAMVAAIVLTVLRIRGQSRRDRFNPAFTSPKWPLDIDVDKFHTRISLFLRDRGWKIESAQTEGDSRLAMIVRKDRCRVCLLFVAPGIAAPAGEMDALDAWRTRDNTTFAALVDGTPVEPDRQVLRGDGRVFHLGYEELDEIDTVFAMA